MSGSLQKYGRGVSPLHIFSALKVCNGHVQHFSSPGENAPGCLPGTREGKSCCQTMVSRDCDHHGPVVPISQIRESQREVVPQVPLLIEKVTVC